MAWLRGFGAVILATALSGCAASSPASTAPATTTPATTGSAVTPPPPTDLSTTWPTPPTTRVGKSWSRIDDGDLVSDRAQNGTMHGILAGGPGAIAWGAVYGTGPRIWHTADGHDLRRATVDSLPEADPENPGEVIDVVATAGGFLGLGVFPDRETHQNTVVTWRSSDGIRWSRMPGSPAFTNAFAEDLIVWRGRVFAVGCELVSATDCGAPILVASDDGSTWARVDLSLPDGVLGISAPVVTAGRILAQPVTVLPDDWVPPAGPEPLKEALASTDGASWAWSNVPLIGRTVGVGEDLFALVRPSAKPAPDFTPAPTPIGQPGVGVYRWEPTGWQLQSRSLRNVGYAITRFGDTLIMVGDNAAGNPQCWARCQATGWWSVDGGATWEKVPADEPGGTMVAVAALADGTLVAVGRSVDDRGWPTTAAWVAPPR